MGYGQGRNRPGGLLALLVRAWTPSRQTWFSHRFAHEIFVAQREALRLKRALVTLALTLRDDAQDMS